MKNKLPEANEAFRQTSNPTQAKSKDSFIGGGRYEIKVVGHLDEHWSEWLGGLTIIHEAQGNSLLPGVIADQAALHGILAQIRDLGLALISLTPQDVEEMEDTDEKPHGNTARNSE